jgi:deazaflavin-dependent oxidoreductase (nitroreductase family)
MLPRVDPHTPRGRIYIAVARFSNTRLGAWLSVHVAWRVDPFLLRVTGGRLSSAFPLRAALLETRGARTGRPRRTATLYFHDGNTPTIVASYRGWPKHPAWYHNIRANPDVVYGGLPFRATIIEDAGEQQRLWQLADRVFPPYADYRAEAARAGREIPLVQLTPPPAPA